MSAAPCPVDEVLARFSANLSVPEEAAAVQAHLVECASCRTRLAAGSGETRTMRPAAADVSVEGRPAEISQPMVRGETVGRYLVVGPLGEGGMGVVYLAYDPELDRKVALKLMRADTSGGKSASVGKNRLLREAQAMAKLHHPNVVAIHDVGPHGDKVFLALELVEGKTVRQWIDEVESPRPWREVRSIFVAAGRGLAAAHQAGLIHRDFKPSNVLLGKDGRVQVTDFGLARVIESQEEEELGEDSISKRGTDALDTTLTRPGAVMGTPGYMAPEQAIAAPVDPRTDEFSFCVALWEALYGERPFEGRVNPLNPVPPRDAPKGTNVPMWLRRVLLKGIAMRPDDRYATMDALLAALEADPGVRTRRLLTAGGATFLAILFGSVVTDLIVHGTRDACSNPQARLTGTWDPATQDAIKSAFLASGVNGADATWAYTEKSMNRTAEAWVDAFQGACRATREDHAQSEAALQLRLDCLESQRLELHAVSALLQHADKPIVGAASGAMASLPQVSDCADARALAVIDQPTPQAAAQVEALRVKLAGANALAGVGKNRDAIPLFQAAAADAQKLGFAPLQAQALMSLAKAQGKDDDFAAAVQTGKQALELAESSRMDQLSARAASRLLIGSALAGRPTAELESLTERTRALAARVGGDPSAQYELEHARCVVENRKGHSTEMIAHCQKAVELARSVYGADHPEMLSALDNLGAALDSMGRYDEELATYRQALAVSDAIFGPDSNGVRVVWTNTAELLADLGRLPDAEQAAQHVLTIAKVNSESLDSAIALAIASWAHVAAGHVDQGLAEAAQASALGDKLGVASDPDFADVLRYAAGAHLAAGRATLAQTDFAQILTIKQKALEPDSAEWVSYLMVGGAAFLAAGQPDQAKAHLERALALSSAHPFFPGWVAQIRFDLAKALVASNGDRARAVQLAKLARADLANLPERKAELAALDAWQQTLAH